MRNKALWNKKKKNNEHFTKVIKKNSKRNFIYSYKDWKNIKLGEAIMLIGGGTPKTSVKKYWNGDIPWLSVTDFNNR